MSLTIRWSREALRLLQAVESPRFSARETAAYRRRLMGHIERKVQVLGTSMPSPEEHYMGTYRILVDTYKVYYSLNAAHTEADIEAIKHMRMQWPPLSSPTVQLPLVIGQPPHPFFRLPADKLRGANERDSGASVP